ncbi:MAG TPA: hypothetical protein G4O16_04465, partial [Dehalococcoidia bacterium]|nr:hypothetical protein [Dehalococcoidia bacterium]
LAMMPLIGPDVMFITAFQGLSRGTMALVLSLVRQFIVFVPILYLLSYLFGLNGVWYSLPTSDIVGFLVAYAFIYAEYRRQKKLGNWKDIPVSTA